jgi:hypothetical protein
MPKPTRLDGAASIDRRHLLAGTGSAVSVAGCLSDTTESVGQETAGGTTATAQRSEPNRPASGRIGDTVYYDPENPGPYENGKAALETVPDGGTFRIAAGEYDVSEEGGRLVADRPVHIRGAGTNFAQSVDDTEDEWDITNLGTVVTNREYDQPTIEFRGELTDGRPGVSIRGASIQGLAVRHLRKEAPAVRFRGTIYSLVKGAWVLTQSPVGVKYDDWAFFARMVRSKVSGASNIGVHVTGGGYAHEFYSNHVGAPTALQTENHRTIVVGGEYAAGEDGTALRFYNPHDYTLIGGVVVEPGIEHTGTHVDIDGTNAVENVHVIGTMLLPQSDVPTIRFGNAHNCKVLYPALSQRKTGYIAHWTDQSRNCGIVSDAGSMQYFDHVIDDGAINPYVHLTGSATRNQISNVLTGPNISVDQVVGADGPVFSEGDTWYTTDSARTEMEF